MGVRESTKSTSNGVNRVTREGVQPHVCACVCACVCARLLACGGQLHKSHETVL